MGKLIDVLNRDPENFKEWTDSGQKQELDELPISVQDFNRWLGINNLYFMIRVRWIIREVWMDSVEPRFGEVVDERLRDKVSRAVVYSVMALACKRLAMPIFRRVSGKILITSRVKPTRIKLKHISGNPCPGNSRNRRSGTGMIWIWRSRTAGNQKVIYTITRSQLPGMINLWWYDRDTRETQKDCFAVSMGRLKHETIYFYYREVT